MVETPPQRVMRQWFQAKLGERMGQFAQMSLDRELLRRGARKMQDGTLYQRTNEPEAEDDMNIRVGDEINHHYYPAVTEPAMEAQESPKPTEQPAAVSQAETPVWKTWLKRAAIVALPLVGAAGVAGYNALSTPDKQPPTVESTAPSFTDSYIEYDVKVRPPGE